MRRIFATPELLAKSMLAQESVLPRRRVFPAWLLSALLHMAMVLAVPLLFTSVTRSSREEPQRPVSLVLSRTSGSQTEYFAQDADQADASSPDAVSAPAAEALPSLATAAALIPSEVSLPSSAAVAAGESSLVETPQYRVSGSSRLPNSIDPAAIRAEQAAVRAARAAQGPTSRMGLFGGTAAEGRSFVFLIDRSRSMGSQGLGGLAAAEQELTRALDALRPQNQFQVIAYHHKCVFLNARKLLRATDENKAALQGHVSGLAAFGTTEHEMALMSALILKPDVIFLLTDGGEPALDGAQLRRIRKLAGGHTTIHCIQFGRGPLQDSDNFMQRLAAQNGGGYGYVDMLNN